MTQIENFKYSFLTKNCELKIYQVVKIYTRSSFQNFLSIGTWFISIRRRIIEYRTWIFLFLSFSLSRQRRKGDAAQFSRRNPCSMINFTRRWKRETFDAFGHRLTDESMQTVLPPGPLWKISSTVLDKRANGCQSFRGRADRSSFKIFFHDTVWKCSRIPFRRSRTNCFL